VHDDGVVESPPSEAEYVVRHVRSGGASLARREERRRSLASTPRAYAAWSAPITLGEDARERQRVGPAAASVGRASVSPRAAKNALAPRAPTKLANDSLKATGRDVERAVQAARGRRLDQPLSFEPQQWIEQRVVEPPERAERDAGRT
jgi:hypothetical protein